MKAILERKKSADTVVAASHRWAASTAESLAELLRPELAEGESLPDLELLQQLLGRALARRWQRLESADQARERARERCRRLGGERNAAKAALYRRVVDLRRLLRGVFGRAPSRRFLAIAGDTSRDVVVLVRQARHAVDRLADPSRGLPPASFEPSADDLARWRAPVETAAETLRSASALAAGSAKELDSAENELRRAIADFDPVLVRIASALTGVYIGAGRDERADAVRPSKRRLGRLVADDDRAATGRAATGRVATGRAATGRGAPVDSASVRVVTIRSRRDSPSSTPAAAEPLAEAG